MSAWAINALAFQCCWLAFVGGAGRGWWWAGFIVLLPFAVWQLRRSLSLRADVMLMAIAAALGFLNDSLLAAAGLLSYASPLPWRDLAPVWIVGLWIAFALTLNHSLAFLHNRPLLAAGLGAISGPFAYWVAARAWSALTVHAPHWQAYVALAIAWGVLTPLLAQLAAWLTRGAALPAAATVPP